MLEAVRLWHMARAEQSAVPLRPRRSLQTSRTRAAFRPPEFPAGRPAGPTDFCKLKSSVFRPQYCFLQPLCILCPKSKCSGGQIKLGIFGLNPEKKLHYRLFLSLMSFEICPICSEDLEYNIILCFLPILQFKRLTHMDILLNFLFFTN